MDVTPEVARENATSDVATRRLQAVLGSAWVWPYGALALLLIGVTWPAWVTTDRLVIGADTVLIHYPWFVLWRDALAAGELPFWNPYSFGGIPAFATLQAGYGYPPHWALTWLPPMTAINWLVGLHILLAGLGAAWCAGRLGASREGQFLAGAAYALGSATVARLWAGHLSFFEANAWLPLVTGLAIGVRQRYGIGLLALAIGVLALAGQPEVVIFSLWWLPAWAALSALKDGPRAVALGVGRCVLGIGLGVGLAAFQLLPVTEVLAVSNRQVGMGWDFRTGASLPPWHALEVVAPFVFGEPRQEYWAGPGYEWHERLLYVGLVTLFAALWARGRWAWVCWGLTLLAVALAMGRYVPWYAWTDVLPGYVSLRIPSKHVVLAALGLALAAAIGLPRTSGRRVAVAALLGAAVLGVGSATVEIWLPIAREMIDTATEEGRAASEIAPHIAAHLRSLALLLAAVACAALLPGAWATRGVLLLAVIELVVILHPYRLQIGGPDNILADGAPLRGQSRGVIVDDALVANYGPVLRVVQPGGYVSLFSAGYMELLSGNRNAGVVLSSPRDNESVLRLLGYARVFDRRLNRVSVLEPAPALVWVARCVRPGGALEVREPGFPREQCITRVQATAEDPVVPPGPARIVDERSGWLDVEAEGPGWLVTVVPWYPGWAATVDGIAGTVEAVDGALVAVDLPQGSHRVVLSYRPAGLDRGVATSFASLLLILATVWWDRRRFKPAGVALSGVGASLSDGESLSALALRRPLEGEEVGEGDGNRQQEGPEDGAGQAALPQELGEGYRDARDRGQEVEEVADTLGHDRGGMEGEVHADDPRQRPQG